MLRSFLCAAVLAAAVLPGTAHSQRSTARGARAYLDYYATGVRGGPAQRASSGFGARLMLPLPAKGLERVAVGPYLSTLPDREQLASTTRYGLQGDLRLGNGGAALQPLLTAAVEAEREPLRAWRWGTRPLRIPSGQRITRRQFSPGVAARLRLATGVALRGDLRRALTAGGEGATEVAAGLSLPL